jgi:protein kinase-like protein/PEGA domain-containing protein
VVALRLGACLCSLLILGARPAEAAEWYEAYRQGLQALAQGQPARAVRALEDAAVRRPEPGRNVLTYGTNVEPRYYPYLHLTEAYLQLRDLAGARGALKRSERWGREPADERKTMATRVEELAARLATPAPATPAPTPAAPAPASMPTAPPATEPAGAAGAPAPTTLPAAPAPSPVRALPVPSTAARHASPAPTASAASSLPAPSPSAVAAPSPTLASLDIVSQPPGASVYLDDELIGTTDPEWGRLARSGIAPGRHRVRLTLAGYEELAEEVDVAPGRTDFRRRLSPSHAAPGVLGGGRLVLYGAVAVILLALTGWALRRSAAPKPVPQGGFLPTPAGGRPTPAVRATPAARPTPPGLSSPGSRRDAAGNEYFGEYRLLEPLGRGGMAVVFKAERGGELCALKRPLAAFLAEPEFLERFLREAEIGRTLHHPNIVRILERGAVDDVPFFTMELVAGETLQALVLRQGALEPRLASRTIVQMAEALDYAHSKGVVHRDLKPSNVMVMADGTTKVMDFGIARARRFEGLTVTGAFLGSPEYVAPEAIEGKDTDLRGDLYSLGVIFYEVLTGRRPFAADTPFALLRMHLTEVPVPPTRLRPEVPEELERIVLRLLSKSAEQRYASAEDLVVELHAFLNRAA